MNYNDKQNDPLDTLLTINLLFKGNQKEQANIENAELAKDKNTEDMGTKKQVNFHPAPKEPAATRHKADKTDTNESDDSDKDTETPSANETDR